ncbi:MAG TPA: tRNA pseudouridine(54/55) synthase Pus10 [Planctomycetota bacterium]|nr:tRNA pseudouridine(54/55) synthase Pus10 [Planctomycetota bacterium]
MDAEKPSRPGSKPKVRVFLEGRYRKLVRDLPQTVFFCPECKGRGRRKGVDCARCSGHGKLTKDSVQELIERVALPRLRSWKSKFHGAGREDIDVRMLGTGRPFILEVLNPKHPMADLREIEDAIGRACAGRIEVTGLRLVPKARVAELKETKHPKEYVVVVKPAAPLSTEQLARVSGRKIFVKQRTPERVAHRRADLDRQRWVEVTQAEPLDGGNVRFTLRCEHGTYVKEAVSGEGGRTEPSLSALLGTPCECVELDVTAILEP